MEEQLTLLNDELIKTLGLAASDIQVDDEAKDYYGCDFRIEASYIKFRKAKITPKKVGQFVALWKKNAAGKTAPYEVNDHFDFYVIETQKDDQKGYFIFPKAVLAERQILSDGNSEGKRGFRIYPEWDTPDNKQAIATKNWQAKYFNSAFRLCFLILPLLLY